MNKYFFIALLIFASISTAGHLRLEDSGYETIAYVREDGRIEDASFMPLGRIVLDEDTDRIRIEDDKFNTLGYIDENEFLDSFEDRIFELTSDGRLKNHRFRDVAIIRDDGTVEALNFSVILYTDGSHDHLAQRVAVYMIYFSDLLE
ncbi:MAG: hypothetical protein KAH54_05460 [Candidatus Sabulitectum sp.]|nr:hypothetical protein [Candidatus Sabulitectum sp.]